LTIGTPFDPLSGNKKLPVNATFPPEFYRHERDFKITRMGGTPVFAFEKEEGVLN